MNLRDGIFINKKNRFEIFKSVFLYFAPRISNFKPINESLRHKHQQQLP